MTDKDYEKIREDIRKRYGETVDTRLAELRSRFEGDKDEKRNESK